MCFFYCSNRVPLFLHHQVFSLKQAGVSWWSFQTEASRPCTALQPSLQSSCPWSGSLRPGSWTRGGAGGAGSAGVPRLLSVSPEWGCPRLRLLWLAPPRSCCRSDTATHRGDRSGTAVCSTQWGCERRRLAETAATWRPAPELSAGPKRSVYTPAHVRLHVNVTETWVKVIQHNQFLQVITGGKAKETWHGELRHRSRSHRKTKGICSACPLTS